MACTETAKNSSIKDDAWVNGQLPLNAICAGANTSRITARALIARAIKNGINRDLQPNTWSRVPQLSNEFLDSVIDAAILASSGSPSEPRKWARDLPGGGRVTVSSSGLAIDR